MTEEFKQEQLKEILETVSKNVDKETNVYVFGGAVMVHNSLKPSTKDIDVFFDSKTEYDHFVTACKKTDFIDKLIPIDYKQFDMAAMLKQPQKDWILDVFLKIVCKKFYFTKTVKERAKQITQIGKLKVYHLSLEGIFLMKALTRRDRDLDDMRVILGTDLDFKVINNELNEQKHKMEMLERLFEFEEKNDLKLAIDSKHRKEYKENINKELNELLVKQVNERQKQGKTKQEIMQEFDLTEKEWNQIK